MSEKNDEELTAEQKAAQRTDALAELNFNRMFVWRDTETDGMMPFANFSESYTEQDKKALKETQDLGEQKEPIFKQTISRIDGVAGYMNDPEKKQTFELGTSVYAKDLGCYVQLKKYDEEKKTYECRVVKGKDEKKSEKDDENVKTIAEEGLTKLISVQVRKIDLSEVKSMGATSAETASLIASFRVQTTDKIEKLTKLVEMATGGAGDLFVDGKAVADLELTFAQMGIKEGAKLAMPVEGASSGPRQIWKRFLNIKHTDYYYMSYNYWDAICFIPQKNITWYGFGVLSNRDNNNVQHTYKYFLEEDGVELGELSHADADKDPEMKTFLVDLKSDFGIAPVKVAAGQKLHILMKAKNEESRRTWYIYENTDDYKKRDDQPLDFLMEYSNHDDNGCSRPYSGQFPFIVYS